MEVSKDWMRHQLSQLIKFRALNHLLSFSSLDPLSLNSQEDFFMSLSFVFKHVAGSCIFVCVCVWIIIFPHLINSLIFFSHNLNFKFSESLLFFLVLVHCRHRLRLHLGRLFFSHYFSLDHNLMSFIMFFHFTMLSHLCIYFSLHYFVCSRE